MKAADAAINARQWIKASHILDSIENHKCSEKIGIYYSKLGQHYSSCNEYDLAETAFMKANMPKLAIDMYVKAGMWEKAHLISSNSVDQSELNE